jgi:restriction endonuclease S subunit
MDPAHPEFLITEKFATRITDIDENGQLKDEIASSPSEFDPKYLLKQDDILFARSGATVGKTFLYQEKIGKAIYAGYLICASLDKSLVSPTFVYLLTKTIYYAQYIKRCIRGVAQPNVNAQQYSALPIPVPPLSLQQRFAQQIEAIEQQKAHVEENIQKLQTLLDSRMAYWFK